MLIATSAASGASDVSIAGVIIGVLGLLALLTSAVIIVFGVRNKTVASQQEQSINALEGRVTALESENADLHRQLERANVKLADREREIAESRSRISSLESVVTQAQEIAEFRKEVAGSFAQVMKAIKATTVS